LEDPDCEAISNCVLDCITMACVEACTVGHADGRLRALVLYYCTFERVCNEQCASLQPDY
jgi:hypothetical protein